MSDFNEFIRVIKTASLDAVENTAPVAVFFGTVKNDSPLIITIDQKFDIEGDQIILTRSVTDYDVEMTVDHVVEKRGGGSGDASYEAHDHKYKGRKTFKVHNRLIAGEKVLLIRVSGGQKFVVIDRIK